MKKLYDFFKSFLKESPSIIISQIINLAMLICTITLALFTYIIVIDNRNLIEETIKNNASNSSDTKRSLELTNESLDRLKENFQIENRPYVYVDGFEKIGFAPKGDAIIKGVAHNVGKTHALNVKIFSMLKLFNSPNHTDFLIDSVSGSFSLAPTAEFPIQGIIKNITDKQSQDVLDEKQFYYYFGKITYTDNFGGNYFTCFCVRFQVGHDQDEPRIVYHNSFNDVK